MKNFNRVFTILVFAFLYVPMIVLAVASFNAGTDIAVFKGFTFDQYKELFRDGILLPLLLNSFIVAIISSVSATLLGTMASHGCIRVDARVTEESGGINAWWIWTHMGHDCKIIITEAQERQE